LGNGIEEFSTNTLISFSSQSGGAEAEDVTTG